jgi:hypothetical protein
MWILDLKKGPDGRQDSNHSLTAGSTQGAFFTQERFQILFWTLGAGRLATFCWRAACHAKQS